MYFYVSMRERNVKALPSLGISISASERASERTNEILRAHLRILPKDRIALGFGTTTSAAPSSPYRKSGSFLAEEIQSSEEVGIYIVKRYGKFGLRILGYVNSNNNVKTFLSASLKCYYFLEITRFIKWKV